jgi:hypothetical protein
MQNFNQSTPESINLAIETATNRLITEACSKHGIQPSQLPVEALEDAKRTAVAMVAKEQERKSNPLFLELESAQEKIRLQDMQIKAMKETRGTPVADTHPAITVDQARRNVGEVEWNHKLTETGRLLAIGVAPETATPAMRLEIMETFGPRSSSTKAAELHRSNPGKYRQLKEIGRALRII